jgi:hypothetical protein
MKRPRGESGKEFIAVDGDNFRHHIAENDQNGRDHRNGHADALHAEPLVRHRCGHCSEQDVGKVISQQNGNQRAPRILKEIVDNFSAFVRKPCDTPPLQGGERENGRFGSRKESGDTKEQQEEKKVRE